jgi:hypothetical protein
MENGSDTEPFFCYPRAVLQGGDGLFYVPPNPGNLPADFAIFTARKIACAITSAAIASNIENLL